jgi:hypothetical protein
MTELGPVYWKQVQRRLDDERQRQASLQTRAVAVISTSGVIVSILFAVERAAGSSLAKLEGWTRLAISLPVIAFAVAAVVAIGVIWPKMLRRSDTAVIALNMKVGWTNGTMVHPELPGPSPVEQVIALNEASELTSWEESNDRAFVFLRAALAVELVGILLVALAIALLLINPPA